MTEWHDAIIDDIAIDDVLHQAAPWCLQKLKDHDLSDDWTRHLFSLEQYKDEVIANGWRNPISVWKASEEEFKASPSAIAYNGQTYLPAIGWNRIYWSHQWGQKTIKAIIASSEMDAHSWRSLMEADKRQLQFGIERHKDDLVIPRKKLIEYYIYSVRVPQWIFPQFIFDSKRIVEKMKGDWKKLTGKYNVVRPMPGSRTNTSCFYIISGKPPDGDKYTASFIPEGWIGPDNNVKKYRNLFREWI